MRSSIKLKILLQRYSIQLDLDEEEMLILRLTDKVHGDVEQFRGKTNSVLIGKAYAYMLRTLKEEEKRAEG
ncbi:MAG: hypothetical protein EP332_03655 [Bacteroidetes bacterium]|nr:MAG: hypothetical protein EP332_03655 [Bacteroidota bacterium]